MQTVVILAGWTVILGGSVCCLLAFGLWISSYICHKGSQFVAFVEWRAKNKLGKETK